MSGPHPIVVTWSGEGLEFRATDPSNPTRAFELDGNSKLSLSPVEALLGSLGGCMAADVVDILTKGRVPVTSVQVSLTGERAANPPRRYLRIEMMFKIGVGAENLDKVERAVSLSVEKYCSVMHSLDPDIAVTRQIELV